MLVKLIGNLHTFYPQWVFELNIEMPFLWRWWLPLTSGLLVFPHCTLWLSINSNARGSCSLAGAVQDTTFILLKQIVISKFLQPSEIWQRLWGEYLATQLCVGSANTSCSKQESSSLFFELSYRGLEVASNLLIIRPESPDQGLFVLTHETLSCLSAYSWISSALSHCHFSCMAPSFVWSSLGLLLYAVLFDAMIDLATVLCEMCTSPEVLYNCRITFISSIVVFSNFFFALGSCLRHGIRYPWRFPICFVGIL